MCRLAQNSQVYQGRLNSGILHGEIKRGNSNLMGETESDARGASQDTVGPDVSQTWMCLLI